MRILTGHGLLNRIARGGKKSKEDLSLVEKPKEGWKKIIF